VYQRKYSHLPREETEGLNDGELSINIILSLKLKRVMDLFCWTLPIGDTSGDAISLDPECGVPYVRLWINGAEGLRT